MNINEALSELSNFIDMLVDAGCLTEEEVGQIEAVETAINDFVHDVMEA